MPLKDILESTDKTRIVVESNLNNTVVQPWTFEDFNCGGLNANAGVSPEVNRRSNSFVRLANGSVVGASVNKVIAGDVSVSRSLNDPFTGSAVTDSFGALTLINNDSSDDLDLRDFEDENANVLVGGLINRNKSDESLLTYSEYETWLAARFTGFDRNERTIDVSVGMKSDELTFQFPPNIYTEGESKGLAKPYIYGFKEGFEPMKIGGGIYQFHDGVCDMTADVINNPDFVYFDENLAYTASQFNVTGYDGGATIDSTFYSWSVVDDRELESSTNKIKITEGFELSSSGSTVVVQPVLEDLPTKTYRQHHFVWQTIDDKNLKVENDPKMTVETTGDVDIVLTNRHPSVPQPYRASWFKIAAVGTGNVALEFEDFVKDAVIVVRAVRQPLQNVDNFNVTPDSIDPPFIVSAEVFNHRLTYKNINTKTISFDYTATTSATLCAIWVESVTVYETRSANLTIELNPKIKDLGVSFDFSNESQSVTFQDTSTPTVANQSNELIVLGATIFNDPRSNIQAEVQVGYGGFSFELVSGEREGNAYGVSNGDNNSFVLNPPPDNGSFFPQEVGIESDMKPFFSYFNSPSDRLNLQEFEITFDAEIVSGNTDSIRCALRTTEQSNPTLFTVREDQKSYRLVRSINDNDILTLPQGFYLYTWRGDYSGKAWSATNPDIEFEVKVSNLQVMPTTRTTNLSQARFGNQTEDIRVYVIDENVRQTLPCFRVSDARKYKNRLPKGICLYDNKGFIATSVDYSEVFGDFPGADRDQGSLSALKDIALKASGRDLASGSFTEKRVGFAITEQKPFIQHIAELCDVMDYYYYEDEVVDGITILERYDFESHPGDFLISEDQIIFDSFSREGSAERPYQYIVEYRRDDKEPQFTKKIESAIGNVRNSNQVVIPSVFFNLADNEVLADRIKRDSVKNDICSIKVKGLLSDLRPGQAGIIMEPAIGGLYPCILREVTFTIQADSETKTTNLRFKVLKGRGSFGG